MLSGCFTPLISLLLKKLPAIAFAFHCEGCPAPSHTLMPRCVCTGGYDSEISDDDSDREERNSDSGSSSDGDNYAMDRRRHEFSRRQRDRLKQVELEEKQAMGKSCGKSLVDSCQLFEHCFIGGVTRELKWL